MSRSAWITAKPLVLLTFTAIGMMAFTLLAVSLAGCRSGTKTDVSPVVSDTTTAAGRFFVRLDQELDLSPRQEREVRSILAEHWQQANEINQRYADAPGPRSQAAGLRELRQLRERTESALQQVFTRGQWEKYLRLRAELGEDFLTQPDK